MSLQLEDILNNLKSGERRAKILALEELQRQCCNKNATEEEKLDIFDKSYLFLLHAYTDRYESVRDQAIQTVTIFINELPPKDFNLVNIIQTLAERLGQDETVEPSEEIRLICVIQLNTLIERYSDKAHLQVLQQCYTEITRILKKTLKDSYPSVQRAACDCVISLCLCAETYYIQKHAGLIAKYMFGMLQHKHSAARISAIKALARVALHIDASDQELSTLIMQVSPLLMDSMPLVRRECGQMGVLLLLELRDRYSYFERLIPLVLCCLKDDSPDVVNYILPLWQRCGQLYYDENEEQLNKQEIGDVTPKNYPFGVQRPTIGCRALVQRSLRLLKLIAREMGEWQENIRIHALKLMYQFVLHAEAAMTAKFFEIYGDIARACADAEVTVFAEAVKVADLMGRLFFYDDWCEHGFDGLKKNIKQGYLICFYHMFNATTGSNFKDLLRLSEILITPEFSQNLKPKFQEYVIKMVETLLIKSEEYDQGIKVNIANLSILGQNENNTSSDEQDMQQLYKNLYVITLKVMALSLPNESSDNNSKWNDMGDDVLEEIAARHLKTVDELHEEYFAIALEYVESLESPLDSLSEPILLLHGLMMIAKFRATYLMQLQSKLNLVFQNCEDDAKIKVLSGVSIAMLEWSATVKPKEESAELLKQFLCAVVEPHLSWRAGANAEGMRSLAIATLCSSSQGAIEEAKLILPTFAKYIPNLLEDHAATTRHYAVKCMFNFGSLKIEEMKPIAYATLQRFNDPSGGIRELAVRALPYLCPLFEHEKGAGESDWEHDIWEAFIKQALDMLFLHYEGPDVKLKQTFKDTIFKLGSKHPQICKDSYKRTVLMCSPGSSLLDLEKEFSFLQ